METFDVAIIGGGPAGSACALYLNRIGFSVCLFERREFPREILCGEFLSNEVTASLNDLGLFAEFMGLCPNAIDSLQLHSETGHRIEAPLGFTAYGMKRGTFDHFLLAHARRKGVCVFQPADVQDVVHTSTGYSVRYAGAIGTNELLARRVVAAYGKQNILDKRFGRRHADVQSHLNGIKFHIGRDYCPALDARAIHLFTGSNLYCGVNAVDEGKVTVCMLEQRSAGTESPRRRLRQLIAENDAFRAMFTDAFALFCETVPFHGTGNIFFGSRDAVVDGIFMAGDAAGVIAPLTGDGMGMAFQSARLIADIFDAQRAGSLSLRSAEALYGRTKDDLFTTRLRLARSIQTILLSTPLRKFGMAVVTAFPGLLPRIVARTRG